MSETQNTISLTLPELVNLATILNLLILFSILFFRKQNTLPNKILAFILLIPAINFLSNYLILTRAIYYFPVIIYINQVLVFLFAPLVLYYCSFFMSRQFKWINILNALSVLAILFGFYLLIDFAIKDKTVKNKIILQIINLEYPLMLNIIRGVYIGLLQLYFIQLAIQVYRYSRKLMDAVTDTDKVKLQYLKQFTLIIWILNIVVCSAYMLFPNFSVDFIYIPLIVDVFYIFLLRTSFKNAAVFTDNQFINFRQEVESIPEIEQEETKKILNEDSLKTIRIKVNDLMEKEKVYTDPDINIKKFAAQVGMPSYQVSHFINQYLDTSFFNLMNEKRIELAKEHLQVNKLNLGIEAIGYEVGFNSKTAFYRAFNKYVKKSPGEYLSSIQN